MAVRAYPNTYHTFLDPVLQGRVIPGIVVPQAVFETRQRTRSETRGGGDTLPQSIKFQHSQIEAHSSFRLADALTDSKPEDSETPAKLLSSSEDDAKVDVPAAKLRLLMEWPEEELRITAPFAQSDQLPRVSRWRLLHEVANFVKHAVEAMSRGKRTKDPWGAPVQFGNIWLIELRPIGNGMWQPVLCIDYS